MGQRYPAIKSGYDLFQIATDDNLLKLFLLVIVFASVGGLLLPFALFQRKPLASGSSAPVSAQR